MWLQGACNSEKPHIINDIVILTHSYLLVKSQSETLLRLLPFVSILVLRLIFPL